MEEGNSKFEEEVEEEEEEEEEEEKGELEEEEEEVNEEEEEGEKEVREGNGEGGMVLIELDGKFSNNAEVADEATSFLMALAEWKEFGVEENEGEARVEEKEEAEANVKEEGAKEGISVGSAVAEYCPLTLPKEFR